MNNKVLELVKEKCLTTMAGTFGNLLSNTDRKIFALAFRQGFLDGMKYSNEQYGEVLGKIGNKTEK